MSRGEMWFGAVIVTLLAIALVLWVIPSSRPQIDVPPDSINSTQIDEHGVKCYYRGSFSTTNLSCVKVK